MCAQPDEFVGAHINVRLEDVAARIPDHRIDAVGRDDHVAILKGREIGGNVGLEMQTDPQFAGAVLKDVEHSLATNATESVTSGAFLGPVQKDVDIVPMREAVRNGLGAHRVAGEQIVHRLIREDDAPSKGVTGLVALIDIDHALRVAQAHLNCKIEPGGAATKAGDFHDLDHALSRPPSVASWASSGAGVHHWPWGPAA